METLSRCVLTFLVNSLWQIPLVTAVAAPACWWMRHGPASHRHAVWVAALVAAALLPLSSLRPGEPAAPLRINVSYVAPGAATAAFPAIHAPAATAGSAAAPQPRTVPFARTTAGVLLAAYLLFILFRLGKLVRAWRSTARIRRAAEPHAPPLLVENVWARCLAAFGLHGVELHSSPSLSTPVTAGAWRKSIILPESMFAGATEEVLTTAIGHEMAHIARHDFALNLLYELLYLPVAFHPACWLIRRGIEQTREMACDELVTHRLLEPGVYARSIMRIAAATAGLPQPGYTLGVFDGDILEERIRRLLERPAANLKRARLLLATGLSALAVCAVLASGLALTARAQGGFRDEMKLAGDLYNRGDFRAAVQHFQNAVNLEPVNINAKLFLANALIREFLEKARDSSLMDGARQQYQDVLARDPRNKLAMQGLLAVTMDTGQFPEAHDWALKLIQLDPKDKTGYYTAGFLDWAMVYPGFTRAKQAAGAKREDYSIPDPAVRKSLRDRFLPQVEEGFRMLQVALQLDPNYGDAMAYMNLLDRLKAGLVDSAAESADLIAQADAWVGKALAAKRLRAPSPQPAQAPLDVEGAPPGPAGVHAVVAAPPPPPPPPPPPAVSDHQFASAAPLSRPRNAAERPGSYWQVMGSADLPANTLVRFLGDKGFQTRLAVSGEDHLVRVMVGPYGDAQALEQAKAALEAAGFRPVRVW